jgi:hypothetical protein
MEPEPPKNSISIGWQVFLLFLPALLGVFVAMTSRGYDGLFVMLVLQAVGVVATGIWSGIRLVKLNPNEPNVMKVGRFIGGFLLGGLAYVGVIWIGCGAISVMG